MRRRTPERPRRHSSSRTGVCGLRTAFARPSPWTTSDCVLTDAHTAAVLDPYVGAEGHDEGDYGRGARLIGCRRRRTRRSPCEGQLGDGDLVLDRAGLLFGELGGSGRWRPAGAHASASRSWRRFVIGGPHAEELRAAHCGHDLAPLHHPLALLRFVKDAVGGGLVPQPRRLWGHDRRRRIGVASARQGVQDDVGGADAFPQSIGAGCLDRRQAIC